MHRMRISLVMFFMVGILIEGCIHAADPDTTRHALHERFRQSRVVVEHPRIEGRVFDSGTVVILRAEEIPAKKFRVVQHTPKLPRFHVRDYAQVTIDEDGRIMAAPADFTLDKATRLVVYDLKVKADQVHLLTHTFDPIRLADGTAVYGCTEFIFPLGSGTLSRGDPDAIQGQIERWLALAQAQ
jgi:hypothetical protein